MRSGNDLMEPPDSGVFARRLVAVMTHDKCSVYDLSRRSGISVTSICHYRIEHRNPTLENAIKIARALNISLDWLCGLRND